MYFYVYHPLTRMYEDNTITVDKLRQKFNFECDYKPGITMYSMDYHIEPIELNFYYFMSSNELFDSGYSEKKGNLNNYYYRFFHNTIDRCLDYIDDNLINLNIKDIKTVFVADKLLRNYYGIYYDGVNYQQLNYFIEKYNFDKCLIENFDKNSHYSVSVDFNKIDNSVMKIGIYGLLYG
jgi:hypothetical protein